MPAHPRYGFSEPSFWNCLRKLPARWPQDALHPLLAGLILLSVGTVPAAAQSNVTRTQAATSTAINHATCKALPNFYWEIGGRNGRLASGTRGLLPPKATSSMPIYSASKWLFGAYVYQRRSGLLSEGETRLLNLSSGNTGTATCLAPQSVSSCRNSMGAFNPLAVGSFHYGPAHHQQLAVDLGLGSQSRTQLASSLRAVLGSDIALSYDHTTLASGAQMTPTAYALFLRKILDGRLRLGEALGASAVCTYTSASSTETGRTRCAKSSYSPTDGANHTLNEQWDYSLGHWVETDPLTGDGAFSSAGYAGFYPWIDATQSYYGVLARNQAANAASRDSILCGRQIRKAWMTGIAQ